MSKKSSTFVVDFANKRLRCPATRVVFGKSPLRLKWHFNRFNLKGESVAQQVEHIPFKDGVLGSSPSWFTEREFRLSFLFSAPSLFPFLILANRALQFCLQNYYKKSECARKTYFLFAYF